MILISLFTSLVLIIMRGVHSWSIPTLSLQEIKYLTPRPNIVRRKTYHRALFSKLAVEEEKKVQTPPSAEETTQKYGLEAGLFQSLKSKDGGESAKTLLKKYGIAYLATSIPLAIVSLAICYLLVDNGVDVAALLSKVGIDVASGDASEKVGTFAIAYAAHKAASPIRFPPTVLLTPIVAKLIGKEPANDDEK